MASKMDAPKFFDEGKELVAQAEAELAAGNFDKCAYLCNQVGDRIVKGCCLRATGNELTGHSLIFMCRTTSHQYKKLMTVLPDCAFLEPFWSDLEAGEAYKAVSEADAKKAVASAKKMLTVI